MTDVADVMMATLVDATGRPLSAPTPVPAEGAVRIAVLEGGGARVRFTIGPLDIAWVDVPSPIVPGDTVEVRPEFTSEVP